MIGVDNTTGKHLDGIEHLKQSIMDILLTPLGTRVMRRDYGSRLFDLIDAPINESTIIDIVAATAEALEKWEPRIEVERVVLGDSGNTLSASGIEQLKSSMAQGRIGLTLYGKYLPDGRAITLDYSNLPLISGTVKRSVAVAIAPPEPVEPGIVFLGGAAGAIATATGELGLVTVSEITFYGGFDLGAISGLGTGANYNWYSQQESAFGLNRISLISDGAGGYIGRFEIDASDGGGAPARSEVLIMQDASGNPLYESLSSGTQVYRFRTQFDSSWQPLTNPTARWAHFCRLMSRSELSGTPAWSLLATSEGLVNRIILAVRGGDIDINQGANYELAINTLNPGLWIDWIVTVKYGNTDMTGAISIERKTEGESAFTRVLDLPNIATLQYRSSMFSGSTDPHYLKIGLYRNVEAFTSVIFHDGFTREPGQYSSVIISLEGHAAALATAAADLLVSTLATFFGGFDLGEVCGLGTGGNHNWYGKQESMPNSGITLLLSPTGGYYAKCQINAGDGGGGIERAQVYYCQDETGAYLSETLDSGVQVYRLSTKFDLSWQPMVNAVPYARFFQCNGRYELDALDPAWALNACRGDGSNRIVLSVYAGDLDAVSRVDYALTDDTLQLGKWIDWIVTVKYGYSAATGAIKIERRTEGAATFTTVLNLSVATLQYRTSLFSGATDAHYLKLGLVRNEEAFTSIIYHDNFTREPGTIPEIPSGSLAGAAHSVATATGTLAGTIVQLGGAAHDVATATGNLAIGGSVTPTFYGGFDLGQAYGEGNGGNHNWFYGQTTPNASISVQSSSISAYCGKFTVAPSGEGVGERAEVLEYQDASGDVVYENINSGTQVYRFCTMFDNSWQPMTSTDGNGRWCVILQLHHGTQPFNPALGIDVSGASGSQMSLFTKGGNQDTVTQDTQAILSDQTFRKGEWIDWILTVKYATNNTGFARLDRKNADASSYTRVAAIENVPTLQWNNAYPTAGDHYMKIGIYRGAADASTSILYYDNFTREPYQAGLTMATVPNLYGLLSGAANTAITAAGLTVGTVTNPGNGTITVQSPSAGQSVALNTAVNYTLSSAITFWGNFDNGVTSGHSTGNGHNWYGETSQGTGNNGIQLISDGAGGYYAKFTVNPGTPGTNERYEVYWMQDANNNILPENLNSGTVIYRFRTKFDSTWQTINNDSVQGQWAVIAQLHSPDAYETNPSWSLEIGGDPNVLEMGIRGGNWAANTGADFSFTDGSLRIGEWIDWIITVKYGMTDATGSMKVERKNQGASVYTTVLNLPNIATLLYRTDMFNGLPGDHYFRLGLYGSYQNWTRIMYHDNFTREQG